MTKKIKKVTTTVTTTEEIISSNERTHIICVLDRSGSMASIMSDSIGGFNAFLKKQKELPDEATITVALFDDKYEILFDYVDIKKAEEITPAQWYPRGLTSLYDAIGKTINTEKAHFAKLGDEKPSKVLMVIVTDGHENHSKEYNLEGIKRLIKDCEKDDWNFMYLAANQDAFAVGGGFGISAGNTFNYTATADGVFTMSNVINTASVSYRSMNSNSADFKTRSKSLVDDKSGNITISNNDPLNSAIGIGTPAGNNYFNTTGSAILNNDKK